jgi:hypothetical protein
MAGYEFFKAIPAYLGSPFLFWHEEGEKYSTFPQQFWRKINREIVPYAKANSVDFRPFRFHDLRPVEIHREFITAAARWMMAAKL